MCWSASLTQDRIRKMRISTLIECNQDGCVTPKEQPRFTGMDKTCVYTSFYGFICVSGTDCVQVRYRHIRQAAIPARVVLGTAVFCDKSNQYLVYEFPFCAMHMRVSSVSLPYLQNRLPSLIISAILAQYSSLCDHLVLQFNLG